MSRFSIGEQVVRRMDGEIGVVKSIQPFGGGFAYVVDLPHAPRTGDGETIWSGTEDAWDHRFKVHAHVATSARDCDGDYSGGHVMEMTLQERCDQFGDLHFKERVMGSIVSLHGQGTLEVRPEGLYWSEQTEEGYRAAGVRWCEDECPEERSWQRDHRAESMGY